MNMSESNERDTLPAPTPCSCLAELAEKVDKILAGQARQEGAIKALQKDVALINNYLHGRQVRDSDRIAALPPLFESVPDDDTPTNPGG